MSGTIRSRTEALNGTADQMRVRAQLLLHKATTKQARNTATALLLLIEDVRVAADDTLTDLNNANRWPNPDGDDPIGNPFRLIPDPDSRGAT